MLDTSAVTAGTRGPLLYQGLVLGSPGSDARLMVVAPGSATESPCLDSQLMVPSTRMPCGTQLTPNDNAGLRGGSRYVDGVTGLTLLCIWPGDGEITYAGRRLAVSEPHYLQSAAG